MVTSLFLDLSSRNGAALSSEIACRSDAAVRARVTPYHESGEAEETSSGRV